MKTTPTLEFENSEIKKAKQTKSEQRRVSIEISMELEYVRVSARIPLTFMVIWRTFLRIFAVVMYYGCPRNKL